MAVCPLCRGEMTAGISCNGDALCIGGKIYEPLPWGGERRLLRPPGNLPACPDCGTPAGGIHHHGCDQEECPACRGQAIGCDCHEPGEWDHVRRRSGIRCAVRPARRMAWPGPARPTDITSRRRDPGGDGGVPAA